MTTIQDDRTDAERATHTWLVIGTDRWMSGWGGARGGASYAAWACRPEDRREVLAWVEGRGDMTRVREAMEPYKPGRGCVHLHVYVVDDEHPALARKRQTEKWREGPRRAQA